MKRDRYENVNVEIGDTFVYPRSLLYPQSPMKDECDSLYLLEIMEHPLNKKNISYNVRSVKSFEEACLVVQSEGKKIPRKLEFFPVSINSEDRILELDRMVRCL